MHGIGHRRSHQTTMGMSLLYLTALCSAHRCRVPSPATDATSSENHETFSRNKQEPPPPPLLRSITVAKSETQTHVFPNSVVQCWCAAENNDNREVLERMSGERPRDLEDKIGLLQSNAERLSRAKYPRRLSSTHLHLSLVSYRLWAPRSGGALDWHKCYHQDFEFFHLRS